MREFAVFNEIILPEDIDKTEWKNLKKHSTSDEAYQHKIEEERKNYENWLANRKENDQDIYVRTVHIKKLTHVILFDNHEKRMKLLVYPEMPTDPQKPVIR